MSAPSSGTSTLHMIEAVAHRLEGAPRQLRRRWSREFKVQFVTGALESRAKRADRIKIVWWDGSDLLLRISSRWS